MKNLFQAVREAVPVPEAARCIGLEIRPGDMARCPFHEDRTPSLKLYPDHYYCFGCHAHGDVVDLLTGCSDLRPIEAARLLAEHFGVEDPQGKRHGRDENCAPAAAQPRSAHRRPAGHVE